MISTVYAIKKVNTQTWDKSGKRMPVTVAELPQLVVTQVKNQDKDGYQALQVGFGSKKTKNITKPLKGHLKVAQQKESVRFLKEIKIEATGDESQVKVGETVNPADYLEVGDVVNVTTFSKGTGFTGVMKRWGFSGGPRTHGQSDRDRAPGSIGQGTTPGRVWKGKKMAGRDGNLKVTQQNLMVVKIDQTTGQVWIKGTTPGHRGSLLTIQKVGHKDFVGLLNDKVVEDSSTEATNEQSQDNQAEAAKE